MITLYQFTRCWGLPNASPFCMKLETYLRMANIPYDVVSANNPRLSPKGKIPYIKHDGKAMGDTGLIIDYLKKTFGDPLDAHLSEEQKAIGLAFRRLCEEHLYWTVLFHRWCTPEGWKVVSSLFFNHLPSWKRILISTLARKHLKKQVYAQGVGRHTPAEVEQMGIEDIKAIACYLKDKPYFFGDEPSSVDACIYAFLAGIAYAPISSHMKEVLHQHTSLLRYCERMQQRYFPDMPTKTPA